MSAARSCTVYRIYDRDDPSFFYIGCTSLPIKLRFALHAHRFNIGDFKSRNKLYNHALEYGWDVFAIEELAHFKVPARPMREYERDYILSMLPTLNTRGFARRRCRRSAAARSAVPDAVSADA